MRLSGEAGRKRTLEILKLRESGLLLKQIAALFGLSVARVDQLVKQARKEQNDSRDD